MIPLFLTTLLALSGPVPDATPSLDAWSIGRHEGRMMLQALTGEIIAELAETEVGDLNADGEVNDKDYMLYFVEEVGGATGVRVNLGMPPDFSNGLVPIPAGRFRMGATDESPNIPENELPAHWVELPAFRISRYEVTNAEYRQFVLDGGYVFREYWSEEGWESIEANRSTELKYWYGREYGQDLWPVVGVSWYEAQAYCRWAGGRLPTEAEWEKAARWDATAERSRVFPWGDVWDKAFCNGSFDLIRGTARAGSYPEGASAFGIEDMCGNVWEWTTDCYDEGAYSKREGGPAVNPRVESANGNACTERVLKGGAWYVTGIGPRGFHSSFRHAQPPGYRGTDAGFRLAAD